MGDQLYADVWAPLPQTLREGLAQQVRALLGRRRLPRAARRLPDARQLRRPRVLERLPAAADPGPALAGIASSRRHGDALADALRRLPERRSTRAAGAGRRSTSAPVSFFIADTRSHRTRDDDPHARLMTEEQWEDLEAWASTLHGPGVLVLPQPLLKAGGSKTDRTLRRLQGVRPPRRDLRAGARRARPARHPDPDRRHPHRPRSAAPRSSACAGRSTSSSPARQPRHARTCRRGATSPRSRRTS